MIAQIQHITYNEFLPLLLGRETWRRYELSSSSGVDAGSGDASAMSGDSPSSYDLDIDASTLNSYAAVVGQVGVGVGVLKEYNLSIDMPPVLLHHVRWALGTVWGGWIQAHGPFPKRVHERP